MTITYLDQNAASDLALAEAGSRWAAIRSTLTSAFATQRIICPMPLETLIESAPCDPSTRIAIEDFFNSVSGGTRFRSFSEILIDKTLALVRRDHLASAFGTMGSGWAARDAAARLATQSHSDRRDRMKQNIQGYTFPPAAEDMSVKEICHDSSLGRCGMFWRDLERLAARPTTSAPKYEVPWLIKGLIRHNLTVAEAQALGEAIRYHKWEGIFVNFFDLMLGSQWDHDALHGQRPNYKPNDEIDRWRAAVALGHSDLFITDAYMADLCRRAKVADYSLTVVFSTKQTDEILKFVQ